MKIRKIIADTIVDAKGDKTIKITVNRKYSGSAPLGVSLSNFEVQAFPSNGVPIGIVNRTLHKGLKGFRFDEFKDLEEIERILFDYDESKKMIKLGGNTVIALESALLKGVSRNNIWNFLNPNADELPIPIGCCMGGGKHSRVEGSDFQEFLLVPYGETFRDNAFVNAYIHKRIREDLRPVARTYNKGWVSSLDTTSILDFLTKLKEEAFEKFGIQTGLGIDVAGSHIFNGGYYFYRKGKLTRESQIRYVNELIRRYSLDYVEDPLEENDVDGFGIINGELICGDDIVASDVERLSKVMGKINCVSVKPNQVGSLLKVKKLIEFAKENRIETVMSHRAGETTDDLIADLSVAWKTNYIKTGITGKENGSKIKRLKAIENDIK